MSDKQPLTIVMVEDDPGHARLIEKNLRRAGITNEIVSIEDGGSAVAYLFDHAGDQGGRAAPPLLVLLDLNLPVLDGHQVLGRLKGDARTRLIPVVILTTTDNPREVFQCYEEGCSLYITKPVEYEQFADTIQKLGMFITIVSVPEVQANHG